jgi:hypothetical protein
MVNFADYKKRRPDLDKLVDAAEKSAGGQGREADPRFWVPTRGKDGNGYAVIRFLPGVQDNGVPWVRYWDHAFKGPGGWYIELSLTSLSLPDPMSDLNMKMWNESAENSPTRKVVSSRSRNLRYVSNILVISDPAHPENDGKTFLYRYGKKIHDKVLGAMKPKFADSKAFDPFDLVGGADFVLRITSEKVGDRSMPKYDDSSFKEPSSVGDESRQEALWNSQMAMGEWEDPKSFKTYDELQALLNRALGESAPRTVKQESSLAERQEAVEPRSAESTMLKDTDPDETMALFARLVND